MHAGLILDLALLAALAGLAAGRAGSAGGADAEEGSGAPRVTIGVTGHRVLTETGKIDAGIDQALDRIQAAFPGKRLVLLSPLAEGADRLAARQVLRRPGAELVVPLPLARVEYEKDFRTPASRAEFRRLLQQAKRVVALPAASTRTAAYEAVGHYVVDNGDVLIAIWDGKDPQGQGGTGAVVSRARALGKPVVIVRAGNRKPGTGEPTSLGDEQGRVLFERLPAGGD